MQCRCHASKSCTYQHVCILELLTRWLAGHLLSHLMHHLAVPTSGGSHADHCSKPSMSVALVGVWHHSRLPEGIGQSFSYHLKAVSEQEQRRRQGCPLYTSRQSTGLLASQNHLFYGDREGVGALAALWNAADCPGT